jgi:3-isopropylmalate dehydratase small subunit
VPVTEIEGMALDGVFIGACTTAEEDLILGALVLEAGLKMGLTPSITGKRKVTPGSLSITAKLRNLGLIDIYERAGFEIGAPGCSYCLGIAADKASEGEVWLSSQNRNFKNRMGKGSIGNLASAATVAASSFDMKVRDPRFLLDRIDQARFQDMLKSTGLTSEAERELTVDANIQIDVTEPNPELADAASSSGALPPPPAAINEVITGRVQRFGDHVDTDAIIPAEFMPGTSDEDLGTHCFQYVRPEFRDKAMEGYTIVVAGAGFGSGSSREEAPRALKGCGIKAVIAKSFAFIYARNQPNMALMGITVENYDRFYALALEGAHIKIDVANRLVTVQKPSGNGEEETFKMVLSRMEERLIAGGGVTDLYEKYGSSLFRVVMQDGDGSPDAPITKSVPASNWQPQPSTSPKKKSQSCGMSTGASKELY